MSSIQWKKILSVFGLLSMASMSACTATKGSDPVPAVLTESNAAHTARLKAAVDELLGQQDVVLDTNAFTESSWHSFHRKVLMGREMEAPERLELWKGPDGCYMKRASSGDTVQLSDIDCRAL